MKRINLFLMASILLLAIACKKKECPKPPTADAGPTKAVQLPTSQVTLVGTGQTTNGSIVGYLWSLVAGPSYPLIQTPASATTVVSNMIAGTYRFQLRVTDEAGLTGLDTVSVIVTASAIQTLTLQPANNPNESRILSNFPNGTGNGPNYVASGWTSGGVPLAERFMVKFDFSTIPASATILSAKLSLYANLTPEEGNLVDAHFGTSNAFNIQRITSTWTGSVTWNTQPSSSTSNQVTIPQSTSSFQDNLNIDVTQLVIDMRANNNYGFMGKLITETPYNSRQYYSSFTTNTTKRPKLEITYSN